MIPRITRDDTEHDSLYCKSEDVEQLELETDELKAKLSEYERLYNDLIMHVGQKVATESRHETAKRLIVLAQSCSDNQAVYGRQKEGVE